MFHRRCSMKTKEKLALKMKILFLTEPEMETEIQLYRKFVSNFNEEN